MNINDINFWDVTEEELRDLDILIHDEINKRHQAKVEIAINNFKKAFENLLQLVDIHYDDTENTGYYIDLKDFNKFKFE